MISGLLGIIVGVLRLISSLLLIYCIMSFVMPRSELMYKAASYVEPVLRPFRELLDRFFPRLRMMPLDFSPLVVWLVIDIAIWIINLLRRLVL